MREAARDCGCGLPIRDHLQVVACDLAEMRALLRADPLSSGVIGQWRDRRRRLLARMDDQIGDNTLEAGSIHAPASVERSETAPEGGAPAPHSLDDASTREERT